MTAILAAPAPAPSSFWRMQSPELDQLGRVVRGGMWQHQRDWWSLPNFVRGLVTGYGGGKTLALGKRMIWLALANAPVPVITVSPTYPMARTTIVETIAELLAGKETMEPGLRWHLYSDQPYRFDIRYKGRHATIRCHSGEYPDRLKGANIAAAGIDEPFIQDRAVFDQVMSRIRHPSAKRRELNITGTPEGVIGWGYDLFEGELRQKHDVGLIQCASIENKALPDGYVQRLESTFDDAARAAYVDGKFVNMSSGRVYHAFDATLHMREEQAHPSAEWGCGMDFNVNPMAFVVFWRMGDRLHFVKEFEVPNSDSDDAGQKLREAFPDLRDIYPDASGASRSTKSPRGKSDFDNLRSHGFQIKAHRANPSHRDRFNAANGALKHNRVTISPSGCPELRKHLLSFTHEGMHRAEQKAMGHLLDAFSYPIEFLMPAVKRAPMSVSY